MKRSLPTGYPFIPRGALCRLVNLREKEAEGLLVEVVSINSKTATCRFRRWPEALLFVPRNCLQPVSKND